MIFKYIYILFIEPVPAVSGYVPFRWICHGGEWTRYAAAGHF